MRLRRGRGSLRCGPCRQMFPHLTDLQRRHRHRGRRIKDGNPPSSDGVCAVVQGMTTRGALCAGAQTEGGPGGSELPLAGVTVGSHTCEPVVPGAAGLLRLTTSERAVVSVESSPSCKRARWTGRARRAARGRRAESAPSCCALQGWWWWASRARPTPRSSSSSCTRWDTAWCGPSLPSSSFW